MKVQFDGVATVKEKTVETTECPGCGKKTETHEHESEYALQATSGLVEPSGPGPKSQVRVELGERQLLQAVVNLCGTQTAIGGDARYAAAGAACAALLAHLDERAIAPQVATGK
jgi:hypothetical protein